MSRRAKIIFIAAIAIIVILIIVLLFLGSREGGRPASVVPQPTPPLLTSPLQGIPTPTVIEPPPEGPIEQNPKVIAEDFVERFGSYSNQGNYQNLRDLFPQMTLAMRARTEAFIESNPLPTGEYLGVTARAVSTTVVERGEATAVIRVSTQQQESGATSPTKRITYRTAEVRLVKDGLRWLVDSLEWSR